MRKPTTKRATSVRLSEEARRLMMEVARELGIAQSAVLELAIRDYAAVHLKGDDAERGYRQATTLFEERDRGHK